MLSFLPTAITTSLGKEFPGYKIEEAEKVETEAKGIYYELAMIKVNKKVGIEMGADGKLIKVELKK